MADLAVSTLIQCFLAGASWRTPVTCQLPGSPPAQPSVTPAPARRATASMGPVDLPSRTRAARDVRDASGAAVASRCPMSSMPPGSPLRSGHARPRRAPGGCAQGWSSSPRRATLRDMADAYVNSMLGDGEVIQAEGRQHWMALIRFALQPILVFIAAVVCFGIGTWLTPSGDGLFDQIVRWIDTLLGLVTAGLFILAIVWFPAQVVRWIKRRYLVTDRRVLYVEGVLRRNSRDAGLKMITDVGFRQTFLGRKLGFGDLVIATAANRPLEFRQMRDAIAFKKVIMAAQQGTLVARADEILGKSDRGAERGRGGHGHRSGKLPATDAGLGRQRRAPDGRGRPAARGRRDLRIGRHSAAPSRPSPSRGGRQVDRRRQRRRDEPARPSSHPVAAPVVEPPRPLPPSRASSRRPPQRRSPTIDRRLADIDSVIAAPDTEAATGAAAVTEALDPPRRPAGFRCHHGSGIRSQEAGAPRPPVGAAANPATD